MKNIITIIFTLIASIYFVLYKNFIKIINNKINNNVSNIIINNSVHKPDIIYNRWINFKYKVKFVNDISISNAVSSLFSTVFDYLDSDTLIYIQFKVKESPFKHRSISYLQSITNKDKTEMIEFFVTLWKSKSDDYHTLTWDYIILWYKIIPRDIIIKKNKAVFIAPIKQQHVSKVKLPGIGYRIALTTDFERWGNYIGKLNDLHIVNNYDQEITYVIKVLEDKQEVILKHIDSNREMFKFVDIFIDNNKDARTFNRIIKNRKWYVRKGFIELNTQVYNFPFIKPLNKDLVVKLNIISMDLETRLIGDKMESFCLSIYDNEEKINTLYLSDYKNEKEMLLNGLRYIMKRKYDGYRVYFHNFGKFDCYFITSILTSLSIKIKPIIKDGVIFELKLQFKIEKNKRPYVLYFRREAPYLLLPASLSELATNFNIENKLKYPMFMVNRVSLNYEGSLPEYKDFTKITLEEFNEKYKTLSDKAIKNYKKFKHILPYEYLEYIKQYKNKKWNLKEETIKYCEQDVKILQKILIKFAERIYNLFKINIVNYPTLASLSLAIYRSNFLKEEYKISAITGETYEILSQSYTGGAVDVYKPGLLINDIKTNKQISLFTEINLLPTQKVYRYDVNSLYPYIMRNCAMPIGNATYFEGDLSLSIKDKKPFGFFEVDIETPDDLAIPILQTKVKINNSFRTIAPLGTWTGYYLSEELYNAEEIANYKFKIKRGILFDSGYIFKDFIDILYQMKKESKKESVDYLLSKLIMNSIYGRFGMNPIMDQHEIVKQNINLEEWKKEKGENIIITNIINLTSGFDVVSYLNLDYDDFNHNKNKNISIAIASAVTAYARIYMSQFKMKFLKEGITLYYSDTDSFDLDRQLDPKYVGNELGQLKLEHVFNEAIYLAPKVYGGWNEDYEVVKVKGYKNIISFNELKKVLTKNYKLDIPHEKWYRSLQEDTIFINEDNYTLSLTENKRELLFENNTFVDTKPYVLQNGILLKK